MTLGLFCQADLFSIPLDMELDEIAGRNGERAMTDILHPHTLSSLTLPPDGVAGNHDGGGLQPFPPPPTAKPLPALGPNIVPYYTSSQQSASSTPRSDVIANYGNCPITEVSNATEILAGLRITNSVSVLDNKPALAFVFNTTAASQRASPSSPAAGAACSRSGPPRPSPASRRPPSSPKSVLILMISFLPSRLAPPADEIAPRGPGSA
ncbi:hypothetical protein C8Q80DRAFT_832911 [Daedaleopsis nitida]|nr:hypothetical protein C8Q80DRAFT_832911 [Daedaleopsis nitida]